MIIVCTTTNYFKTVAFSRLLTISLLLIFCNVALEDVNGNSIRVWLFWQSLKSVSLLEVLMKCILYSLSVSWHPRTHCCQRPSVMSCRESLYFGCLSEQLVFRKVWFLSAITKMDSPQWSPFSTSQTVNYETFSNEPFRPPRTGLGGIIRGRLTQT